MWVKTKHNWTTRRLGFKSRFSMMLGLPQCVAASSHASTGPECVCVCVCVCCFFFFFFLRTFMPARKCPQSPELRQSSPAATRCPGLGPQRETAGPLGHRKVENMIQGRAVARSWLRGRRPLASKCSARHRELDRHRGCLLKVP